MADQHRALPLILAAIDNALRNGSYMTGTNLAFEMLCDHLDIDRDILEFRPGWASEIRATAAASSVPTGIADCPSRFVARTGAVVGCRQRGRHLVHSNMAGATLDLVTWVDGDDDVISISPGVPTGTRDRCSCCQRAVSPLDADDRCGHCGPNRARSHADESPCNLGNPTNGDDTDER